MPSRDRELDSTDLGVRVGFLFFFGWIFLLVVAVDWFGVLTMVGIWEEGLNREDNTFFFPPGF